MLVAVADQLPEELLPDTLDSELAITIDTDVVAEVPETLPQSQSLPHSQLLDTTTEAIAPIFVDLDAAQAQVTQVETETLEPSFTTEAIVETPELDDHKPQDSSQQEVSAEELLPEAESVATPIETAETATTAQTAVETKPLGSEESKQEKSPLKRDQTAAPVVDATSTLDTQAVAPVEAASTEVAVNADLGTSPAIDPITSVGDQTSRGVIQPATENQSSAEQRPAVDPARFVSRVARAFETAEARGGGPIEIRLSPPELGAMQLKLEVREGILTASIETETQAARNALLDNLPALRERLAEQEIRVEKFDVDVRQEGRDQQPETDRDSNSKKTRDQEENNRGQGQNGQESADQPIRRSSIDFGDGAINLVA